LWGRALTAYDSFSGGFIGYALPDYLAFAYAQRCHWKSPDVIVALKVLPAHIRHDCRAVTTDYSKLHPAFYCR
jgi:hypothetical protein